MRARRRSSSESEDDDDIMCVIIPTVVAMFLAQGRTSRKKPRKQFIRERINWRRHANFLLQEGQFKQYYRMSYSSFEKLLGMVAPFLTVDEAQSMRRTQGLEPLSKAGQLQCCVSWLAGGSFHHIRVITGVSKSEFYRILDRVMDAINDVASLKFVFPTSPTQMKDTASAFAANSSGGIIQGCIGVIDGWLCPIRVPRKGECGRVDSFFSGHYQRYGLNIQACTDSSSRFTAVSISCPGGMNDARAFQRWALSKVLLATKGPYFVIGDNAYTQSRFVMTPFNKAEVEGRPDRDNYNFFVSQLRIRVEMAFGLLVNKWRVLKKPLAVKLQSCPNVISACMRLHNFCIDEASVDGRTRPIALLREVRNWNGDDDIAYPETEATPDDSSGVSTDAQATMLGEPFRTSLVDHIAANNMHRPARNLDRKKREAAAQV